MMFSTATIPHLVRQPTRCVTVENSGLQSTRSDGDAEVCGWVAAMARGDEAAFRELYDRYHRRLLRLALVLGRGDDTVAHDAVQAAFVTAAGKLRAVESEAHLWNWLARVVRQQVLRAWRSRGREPAGIEIETVPESALAARTDSFLEESLDVALGEMEPDERRLVELFYFDELSHKEIAERLDTTPKAISNRLDRIRTRLRLLIAKKLSHET